MASRSSDYNFEPMLSEKYSNFHYHETSQVRTGTFTTTAIGLLDYIKVIYDHLACKNSWFAENVSLSMFTYYVTQLYYIRMCFLELKEIGSDDLDVRCMVEEYAHVSWVIPVLLSDYLCSIGSLRDSTGFIAHHREIMLPDSIVVEGINGYFGRVDGNTHVHYESRISPGVIAKRLIEDLYLTMYGKNKIWDLPVALRPNEENAGHPTRNLLGWEPATVLTDSQRYALFCSGISVDSEHIVNFSHRTRFCHNQSLMSHVDMHLRSSISKVKCVNHLCLDSYGSVAQQCFQQICASGDFIPNNYGQHNIANCGFAKLERDEELLAHVSRFRLKKDEVRTPRGSFNTWCCYDFKCYSAVPESWILTKNMYIDFGNCGVWNEKRFCSPSCDPVHLLRMILE